MEKDNVINMETGNTKEEILKRRVEMVKDIAVASALRQLQDPKTFQYSAAIGLWQGLKYRGNLGQGLKAGVAGVAVFTGCSVIVNLVNKIDDIKNA